MKPPGPRRFDTNIAVIGGGSAGLVSAYIGATLKARVVLFENGSMGGDCLNTGCVPSKALIAAAGAAHRARHGGRFGVSCRAVEVDFERVMSHVQRAIASIAPNDSVERYTALGVQCVAEHAELIDPWTVRAGSREYTARNVIVASGAAPAVPPIPGIGDVDYLTSDSLWTLRELPRRLVILGGGPIGCELAQAFARLGSDVTVVEMQQRLVAVEDEEIGSMLRGILEREGVRIETATRALEVRPGRLRCEAGGFGCELEFDTLLVATGRRPRVEGLGLEAAGVEIRGNGIRVNRYLQTTAPSVYGCGDVVGPFQFTHAASHQAWHATVNALFSPLKRFAIDYRVLPWTTYTDPEIGRVGLNESEARDRGIRHEVTRFDLGDLDRAIAAGETEGMVKIITEPGRDRILGASIVAPHAGELISTLALAMRSDIGLNRVLSTVFPYPAWSEALKRTAGQWKSAHAPGWAFPWLERFNRWRRGGA